MNIHRRLASVSSKRTTTITTILTCTRGNANIAKAVLESLSVNTGKTLWVEQCSDSDKQQIRTTSNGEFVSKINRISRLLADRFKVARSDRVVVQAEKSIDAIATMLAIMKLGACFIPLGVDYTGNEITYFINDARPKLIVSDVHRIASSSTDRLTASIDVKTISQLANEYGRNNYSEADAVAVESDECASICYTSGTTGKPKGAMLTHVNLVSNAEQLGRRWRIVDNDILLHCLPINHVHGLFIALNTSLLAGASIVLLPKFTIDSVSRYLPKCSLMMGVPTYYTRMLANIDKFPKTIMSNVRLFISGSAPLLPATWNHFNDVYGQPILERYGMTEGLIVCSNPFEPNLRRCGSVGTALDGIQVRLGDDNVLQYRGANVFSGYWNDPIKTRESFTNDGYLISGDIASIDDKGYVTILGRSKDLVISGGLNVYPSEVELVINTHPNVEESAVIGVAHSDFGEAVVAIVVEKQPGLQCSSTGSLEYELESLLSSKLAKYKLPKRYIIYGGQLPRNAMGKVQKNVLRTEFAHLFKQ